MAKKIVKKRKLKIFNFLLVLLILIGLFFGIKFFLSVPVKNIIIKKTTYLNDDYILDLANLKDYPSYFSINGFKIKKELEKSPYIDSVKIKRDFFHVISIEVVEAKAIFYDNASDKVV